MSGRYYRCGLCGCHQPVPTRLLRVLRVRVCRLCEYGARVAGEW